MARKEKFRLMIDFNFKKNMERWFNDAKASGFISEDAMIRPVDALDEMSHGTSYDKYIVRRPGH